MSYQVLARKWRPRDFGSLVGQEHVVRALRHALEQQRLHHAYLFTGTRGVGKTTLARILAKCLNCETGITPKPCGKCRACIEIDAGRFVDLLEVDAATNTKVDEMRELLDTAQYMPTRGRFKVYVIDEVHMLSRHAFNSMLKTLEEPPEHVKFILATTDPQKIPVTVLSRCLQFNLKQMPPAAIAAHLAKVLTAEKVAFEADALPLIARAAAGQHARRAVPARPGDRARRRPAWPQPACARCSARWTQTYLVRLLECVAAGDAAARGWRSPTRCRRAACRSTARWPDLAALLLRVALAQAVPDALEDDRPSARRREALAARLDAETVQLYYQIALQGRHDLPLAPDEYAGFMMTVLRMLAFRPEGGPKALPVAEQAPTRCCEDAGPCGEGGDPRGCAAAQGRRACRAATGPSWQRSCTSRARRASWRATPSCARREGNVLDLVVPKSNGDLADARPRRQAEGRARAASGPRGPRQRDGRRDRRRERRGARERESASAPGRGGQGGPGRPFRAGPRQHVRRQGRRLHHPADRKNEERA